MSFSLLDFPNEVLLHAVGLVSNADLEKFALTCKTIHSLAGDFLHNHRERKKQYANITYGDPKITRDNTTWVRPTLMLRGLLNKYRMCCPTAVSINDHACEGTKWDDGRDIYDDDDDEV